MIDKAKAKEAKKLTNKIEIALFRFLFHMTDTPQHSTFSFTAITIIISLQSIGLLITEDYVTPFSTSPIIQYFSRITKTLTVSPWIMTHGKQYYSVICIMSMVFLICFIVIGVLIAYLIEKQQMQSNILNKLKSFPKSYYSLISSVVFIPNLLLLISIIDCMTQDGINIMKYDGITICYSPKHLSYMVLFLGGCIIMVALCILLTAFSFDNNMCSGNAGRIHGRNTLIYVCWNSVFMLLQKVIHDSIILPIFYLIMCVISVIYHIKIQPHFSRFRNAFTLACLSFNGWFALIFVLSYIFKSIGFQSHSFIVFACCVPVILIVAFSSTHIDIVCMDASRIKSTKILYKYILSFAKIKESISYSSSTILTSMVYTHRKTCSDSACYFQSYIFDNSSVNSLVKLSNRKVNENILDSHLHSLLKQALSRYISLYRFPKCVEIHLLYIDYLICQKDSQHLALSQIEKTKKCNIPIDYKFVLYKYE